MNDSDVSAFGELVQTLRSQRGISQSQLADRLDVHRNTIGKWERSICLPESKTIVLELARQLQLDAHDTQRLLEASLTAFSPHWYLPSPRNLLFTGRDALLHHLHGLLGRERTAALYHSCALSGLGGLGKTQVAIEYAYRYAHDYAAILWIAAETRESIIASFMILAHVLHLPDQQDQDRVVKAVGQWLNGHREWLLIFDNVENLGLVKSFLPAARSGAVLLTTRLQNTAGMAQIIRLKPLTTEEGFLFLLRRSRLLNLEVTDYSLPPQEVRAAQEILMLMDGLPLALDQAGAYIEAAQCNLQDYLFLLQSSQHRLLNERDAYADHPVSVSKTFTLAFEQLEQSNPQAAELLTVCAFLASEDIPESFFSEGAVYLGPTFEEFASDPFCFNAAIKALQLYSFIQRNAYARTITVHQLVQAVLKGYLSEAALCIWRKRVIRAMSYLFPSDENGQASYWQISGQLFPHALACIAPDDQCDEDEVPYISLMNHIADYLSRSVHLIDAQLLYSRALDIGERMLGSEHPVVVETLCGLACLYYKQDKDEEAELFYQRALRIRKWAQEMEHPMMAEALNGLAMLYWRQGKYNEAEALFRRALRIREQAPGGEHPQVATLFGNLAELYREQGKHKEAEPLYRHALRIREQVLGSEHPQVATLLNNLAELYREQGKHKEAEPLYRHALRIWEQELGLKHPRVAHPLHGLAELYREQGKYKEAEPLYQRALHISEQELGPEHSMVVEPLHGLAELYGEQGKYKEAEPLYQRALRISKQTLGPEHLTTAEILLHLACFYQAQEQTTEAVSFYQQALAICERMLGPHHPKTIETRLAADTCLL